MQAVEQFIKWDVLGALDVSTGIFLSCAHVDDYRSAPEKLRYVHFGSYAEQCSEHNGRSYKVLFRSSVSTLPRSGPK